MKTITENQRLLISSIKGSQLFSQLIKHLTILNNKKIGAWVKNSTASLKSGHLSVAKFILEVMIKRAAYVQEFSDQCNAAWTCCIVGHCPAHGIIHHILLHQ